MMLRAPVLPCETPYPTPSTHTHTHFIFQLMDTNTSAVIYCPLCGCPVDRLPARANRRHKGFEEAVRRATLDCMLVDSTSPSQDCDCTRVAGAFVWHELLASPNDLLRDRDRVMVLAAALLFVVRIQPVSVLGDCDPARNGAFHFDLVPDGDLQHSSGGARL